MDDLLATVRALLAEAHRNFDLSYEWYDRCDATAARLDALGPHVALVVSDSPLPATLLRAVFFRYDRYDHEGGYRLTPTEEADRA